MINRSIISGAQKVKEYLSYGLVAITAVLLFALLGNSNKWLANLFYLFLLLPSVCFLRKYLRSQKVIGPVIYVLFLYSFYSACVLFFDGADFEHFKYFILLVLFYIFVLINFNTEKRVLGLFFSVLFISFLFLTYGALDAGNLGIKRYDFGGVNANRLTVLFALPFSWFAWYCFSTDKSYKYFSWFLFFLYVAINFYLMGSRSIILLVGSFLVFFIYDFRNKFTVKETFFMLFLVLVVVCFFIFYDPLYDKLLARGSSRRIIIWIDVINHMSERSCFLFGCGKADTYKFIGWIDNPHGVFISSLYYYGVIGLLLFLLFLVFCFINLEGFYRAWFVAFLAYGIFTHVELIEKPSIIWLYFWLPLFIGLINNKKIEYA